MSSTLSLLSHYTGVKQTTIEVCSRSSYKNLSQREWHCTDAAANDQNSFNTRFSPPKKNPI